MRMVRRVLWVLVAFALLGFGWLLYQREMTPERPPVDLPDVSELGGPFTLTDHRGNVFTQADVEGGPYAVFFGFTHCPDVCPTTLHALSELMPQLGEGADRLKILFVTVDPERDTPEQLALYMSSFDPRITALSGSPEETARMIANFKAYARKVPTEGGSYTMDHTSLVFLMGADGRFVSTLDQHEPTETQLGKLQRLLARSQ